MSEPLEVYCNKPKLSVLRHHLEKAFNTGRRVIWNFEGLRREVPSVVLANALDSLHDWEMLATKRDSPPPHVGIVLWEQTVEIRESEDETRDL